MLASLAPAVASETNYRLAGIVAAGSEGSIALIELPDGRQRFFRAGDALGDGRIREINAAGVRIELAHEDLVLRLRGNPMLLARAPEEVQSVADDETDVEHDDNDTEAGRDDVESNRQLSASDVMRLLTSTQDTGEPRAGGQPPSAEALRRQLNDLLEIPADALVTGVDQASVSTPQQAIEALASRLDQGGSVRLTVSGAGALETIVLSSDSEQ